VAAKRISRVQPASDGKAAAALDIKAVRALNRVGWKVVEVDTSEVKYMEVITY
jgi:hypothetical protein